MHPQWPVYPQHVSTVCRLLLSQTYAALSSLLMLNPPYESGQYTMHRELPWLMAYHLAIVNCNTPALCMYSTVQYANTNTRKWRQESRICFCTARHSNRDRILVSFAMEGITLTQGTVPCGTQTVARNWFLLKGSRIGRLCFRSHNTVQQGRCKYCTEIDVVPYSCPMRRILVPPALPQVQRNSRSVDVPDP